jgi:hypothetical protein
VELYSNGFYETLRGQVRARNDLANRPLKRILAALPIVAKKVVCRRLGQSRKAHEELIR